ncbi:hypothetical protein [Planosporangium flavigriseum]|nr:hypothetical protein [Planosporangium flavigriseum]
MRRYSTARSAVAVGDVAFMARRLAALLMRGALGMRINVEIVPPSIKSGHPLYQQFQTHDQRYG